MAINHPTQVLTFLVLLAMVNQDSFAQVSESDSAYVARMMSLDRNGDGLLQASELPGKLAELLQKHDSNSDSMLDRSELASIEAKAQSERMSATTGSSSDSVRNRGGQVTGGPARGPRGGGRRPAAGVQGSPLDAEQILRFALTFDTDKDGGLNADELKRYASALAVRRAVAQQNRANESGAGAMPKSSPRDEPPKGLGSPGADTGEDPFGGSQRDR